VYEHFDFPTVGENIYSVGQPSTGLCQEGIVEAEEDEWIGDCRVWTETAKCEERICEEN
jgi:hypothetical protein